MDEFRLKSGKELLAIWKLTTLLHFASLPRFGNALTFGRLIDSVYMCDMLLGEMGDVLRAVSRESIDGWMNLAAGAWQ
jgi:hypothetical protein